LTGTISNSQQQTWRTEFAEQNRHFIFLLKHHKLIITLLSNI